MPETRVTVLGNGLRVATENSGLRTCTVSRRWWLVAQTSLPGGVRYDTRGTFASSGCQVPQCGPCSLPPLDRLACGLTLAVALRPQRPMAWPTS